MRKKTQIAPLSIRLTPEMDARLDEAVERTKQTKNHLARMSIEAAVEAIERNNYKLVVPIEFEVKNVAVKRKDDEEPPQAFRKSA